MALREGSVGGKYTDAKWYEYWRKTDTELKIIMRNSASKVLTSTLGVSEEFDAKGDYAAAEAVLSERSARPMKIANMLKKLDEQQEQCLFNIRIAHTPNAQLIAAILEDEDGKGIEELQAWCDELSEIDKSDLAEILDLMVKDGVLYLKDGKYYLLRICDESLSFDSSSSFLDWACKKIGYPAGAGDSAEIIQSRRRDFLEAIYSCCNAATPFFPEDLLWQIDVLNEAYQEQGKWAIRDSAIVDTLELFVENGILIKDGEMYYVPFFGQ